jgi:hypothetical protein
MASSEAMSETSAQIKLSKPSGGVNSREALQKWAQRWQIQELWQVLE